MQAAAVTYPIAFGPRAGHKVLTLQGGMLREATAREPLCADIDCFSLHAAVRCEAHNRKRLEQLCRYVTRPASPHQVGDMHCRPKSGAGELKIIAAIRQWPVIDRILEHLRLQPQPPPRTPAREPGPHMAA